MFYRIYATICLLLLEVLMPSKNFLPHHQLDADFWTEFPYTLCQEEGVSKLWI
jgi:hypothetical protein